ncbi:acyl-CoA reductase-like NAD-dependent aldehyde dehydrogenase [Tumebacillus sp. BK434]|uniref:aldehyde dehydrogenase family protein n=1 Tax=Tumebacillus sp. BK434 TaxID=2512169 RepID=UPI00104B960C|nr:aldehyde dehydrogenase family protein [Tumebacillus sp. BK434]TCP59191.1 acyl-CoA reductase-like NAD-dependent aldehyde dehydrogenase [Tumebacillus sp. BK434]
MTYMTQYNPATGEAITEIPETDASAVQAAMKRARDAFPAWSRTPLDVRLGCLKRLREHLVDQMDPVAQDIAKATGKVQVEAVIAEIFPTVDTLRYIEKNAARILAPQRVKTPLLFFGNRSYVEYKPMGVIGVISPWNYPLYLSIVPVLSALIAGNTVLFKPSEVTPLVGAVIEDLFAAAGFPPHVVQVLHGGRETGQAVVAARPDKLFFTGSVATGKKIMAAAAEHLIPVELELGGKDPMIVFADANIDRAVKGALWGAFTNAGQVCMSVERVYVEASVYDEFVRKAIAATQNLRPGIDYGSMTYPPQLAVVEEHLADALEQGAKIECGGARQEPGLYFAPTVLTGVTPGMRIMREETFGPVLPIMPFQTEQEVIALANDSDYGLNASVWSQDLRKAKRVASQLISGNVCVNDVITTVANPHLPFGGVKHSGMGRYHGPEGLHTFSHQTSVMVNKGTKPQEINWHPYTPELHDAFNTLTRVLYGKNRSAPFYKLKNLITQVLRTYKNQKTAPQTSSLPQPPQNNQIPM